MGDSPRPAAGLGPVTITIGRANPADVDAVVALGARLFEEDAAVHDTYIDLTWSEREGRGDVEGLLASPSSLVLVARRGPDPVGHLVGYIQPASPTRDPVSFAVLRSLYVVPKERRGGTGRRLVSVFIDWARSSGCVEVDVSSYGDNHEAQAFYQSLGFEVRTVVRTLPLRPEAGRP